MTKDNQHMDTCYKMSSKRELDVDLVVKGSFERD